MEVKYKISDDLLAFLRCPKCGAPLRRAGGSLLCGRTDGKAHCFDLSASGYCDLSGRQGGSGDPKSAVSDRTAFLDGGWYQPLAGTITGLARTYAAPDGLFVDEGCGEGYYSEQLAEDRPSGFLFGADLSKFAVDRASRRRNAAGRDNSFYAVASVFELPLADGCAAGALCMFSPVAEAENLRVLRPGGILIVGSAGPRHLLGLKEAVYEQVYLNEARADLPAGMELLEARTVAYEVEITNHEDVRRLFGMTPYRFRTPASAYERLEALSGVKTGVEVEFRVYMKH